MREQTAFLENVAEPAPVRWHVDAPLAVEQHLVAHRDAAARRRQQAGEGVDDRCLASARTAEQGGDAGTRHHEFGRQREIAEGRFGIDLDHCTPRIRLSRRRATISDASSAVMATITAMTHSRKAGGSPPGTCVKAYSARGRVWVSPGMLETKVMVAPNSPTLRAKPKIAPVRMPGAISGKVIVQNTRQRDAPSVRAAASSRRSMVSSDRRIARAINGKPITAEASAAPFQLKATVKPNVS